ncbi:hypothetical protein GCM10009760_15930 [Kitasatospora kazusensis]|uniref:Uncharacterized protein n=1 Tax=Kitasatospora kazusensis TaxID=407974 RepID=A0ABN2Z3Y9_9ACTN
MGTDEADSGGSRSDGSRLSFDMRCEGTRAAVFRVAGEMGLNAPAPLRGAQVFPPP